MVTRLPVSGESKEESVPVEKIYQCYDCMDTGEVGCQESDGEGHYYSSTRVCHCVESEDDYEPDMY
jgi:hypothetical protein